MAHGSTAHWVYRMLELNSDRSSWKTDGITSPSSRVGARFDSWFEVSILTLVSRSLFLF